MTQKEKKLLTILHEAKLVDGKLLKEYQIEVNKSFYFSDEELHKAIEKFLKSNLLEKIKLKDDEVIYVHTKNVSKEMIDDELFEIGC